MPTRFRTAEAGPARHRAAVLLLCLLSAGVVLWPLPARAWQEPETEPVAMVRITTPAPSRLGRIARLGIETFPSPFGGDAILFLTSAEQERLRSAGISFEIIEADAAEFFARRLDTSLGPGSMGGYFTFTEIVAWMDRMAAEYPDIISPKFSLATSLEGRPVWAFIVSDAPDTLAPDHTRPAVFYNSLIHAREPISAMLLLGFVEDIARKHSAGDPGTEYLLASREMWFVPVVNPDGYVYNEIMRPGGGYMWRKNKRDNNADGIFHEADDGVDLNRNFAYHWGEDDIGSSSLPGSETYRGAAPFSEPETASVREVFDRRDFALCLNYHAYQNVYLYPFGYTSAPVDRLADFQDWAARLSDLNHFPYGTGVDMIGYATNGDAVDWEYGERGVMAMVAEVGTWYDYFWPPTERIPTLVDEHVRSNWMTAWQAGGVILPGEFEIDDSAGNANGWLDTGEEVRLGLSLSNGGFTRSVENATATVSVIGSDGVVTDASATIGTLAPGESVNLDNAFGLRAGTSAVGHRIELALLIQADDGYTRIDTLGVVVGEPASLVVEGWESGTGGWDLGGFARTDHAEAATGTWYLSDAPEGTVIYADNWSDLLAPISLSGYHGARLRFQSRRALGARNIAMVTLGTHPAPRPYPSGSFTVPDPVVYFTTGTRTGWEEVTIDLTPFAGTQELWVSWWSHYFTATPGWGIDDIRLEAWTTASGQAAADTLAVRLGPPYPNPANPSSSNPIHMTVDLSALPWGLHPVSLHVYDTRGRSIVTIFDGSLENRVHEGFIAWNGRDSTGRAVPSGIYLIELRSGSVASVRKVIILR